ncbi:MAG: hypothetical protein OZSIB_2892 [Candidatus Ozemobacter sibiricus]|uniref:Transglutaminase-like domain-containing protein n=1 Tax=Candidatus Ozemobacter sibiricus TaxID=2268124 RepID=A0A367ZS63_9BACT|nr:MAG: hypothetical protein OZSIB_2892 [Candidatus Ozemobacter sibiricus]
MLRPIPRMSVTIAGRPAPSGMASPLPSRRRVPSMLFFILGLTALIMLYGGPAGAQSGDRLLDRFFPPPALAPVPPTLTLPALPAVLPVQVSVEQHNQAVHLNNQGVDALQAGRADQAVSLFEQGAQLNPGEVGLWKNLLAAQRQAERPPREIIQTALRIMAMDPAEGMAPYAAGMAYLDQLKSPREALPFLAEAVRRQPNEPRFATALASAWDKAGFPDQALAILKEKAAEVGDDPYPLYLLGNLLVARGEFPAAVRALRSAKAKDTEGYAHDAYLRARFAAGDLVGLDQETADALRRFPRILNRASLERILFSLQPHEYDFVEEVRVQIANPADIRTFHFVLRFPPDVPDHQKVQVKAAEIETRGRRTAVTWTGPDADGRFSFPCTESPGATVILRVQYRLQVVPWLGQRGPFRPTAPPDLERLRADPKLSLADPRLERLLQRLAREPGNFLQNAYRAVGRGLSYRENFEDRSVAWALDHPDQCDCTEFARLLAALALKRGIPTRVITGFLVKEEFLRSETNVGHAWCEVHFRDKGWVPVDPTLGVTLDWAYFGNLLSDQIVFDYEEEGRKSRIGVDFVSTTSDVGVKISNTYRVRLIR